MWTKFEAWLHDLLRWVEGWAASPYGAWALFVLAFAESSFFPIAPDVLLIALVLGDPSRWLWFAAVCSLGSVLGGILGYGIGLKGGRPILKRFFGGSDRVRTVEQMYDRYNAWATGIAGLTPIPYKVFTIAGGVFAVNFRIFVLASALSRSARFFLVAGLVAWFGDPIRAFIERYLGLLTIAFVLLVIAGFWLLGRGSGRIGRQAAADSSDDLTPPF